MRPEDMTLEDRIKIAALVSRFFEAIAAQEKRERGKPCQPCAGAPARWRGGGFVSSTPISTRGFFKKCCQS
jgi:hypothetical protein